MSNNSPERPAPAVAGRAVQRDSPLYAIETVSPVYATVCSDRGPDWFDVDTWRMPISSPDEYRLCDWIGGGKYSDCFTAYQGDDYTRYVAIKILKPVRPQKYVREAKILMNLRGGPNIVELYDIVQHPRTQQLSFVFEHVEDCTASPDYFEKISPIEARFYLYQLLRGLKHCHSCGIMHRDVKPLNILFDAERRKLRIIDFGLAEFYHPKQRYNIHVASRNFKAPELLLDYQCYDYSVDMWAFGVTMACIIFCKIPFFKGSDDFDMVTKIANVLGLNGLKEYAAKYGLELAGPLQRIIARNSPRSWDAFINDKNSHLATSDALDLISRLLVYDHVKRATAEEALGHPYFDPVRNLPAG